MKNQEQSTHLNLSKRQNQTFSRCRGKKSKQQKSRPNFQRQICHYSCCYVSFYVYTKLHLLNHFIMCVLLARIFTFNFKSGTTDPATDDKSLLRLKNVDSIRKYSLTKLAIGWRAYIVQRQSLKAF